MTRILARHIIYQGKDYGLSVVEISHDATTMTITPYEREIAATAWVDGPVEVVAENGRYSIKSKK